MKQKTLLTRLMLLLLVLVGGIGTVWADETSYTATDTDKPTATNGTTTKTLSGTNSVSWSLSVTQNTKSNKSPHVSYDKTNSYWQLGSSNSPCTAFSISTSGITGTITKVEVITGSASTSSKINVSVGGSAFGTQNQSTGSGSTLATQTFTGSASGEIIVSATASSGAFYFKSVKVTYTSAALSSIAVTTPPTTIDYKVGEAFSSDGMVVTGTYSDASTKVISGYTMAIGETALADGDVLNSAGSKTVTITYDGKTCTQDITVHALSSISLSGTYPTLFTEKDEFSHEGLVVTAKYDDNSTKDVTSEVTFSGYAMNTVGPQTVTVSYAPYEGATPVTTEYNITVNAGTRYTVTFDAQTGTCEPASLTENAYQGGVVLPSATCSKSGWVFAGWAEAAVTNTTTKPALYEAGDTYYPKEPKTLYAVYKLDGIDDSKYKRATTVEEVITANSIIIVNNKNNYVLNHSRSPEITAPTENNSLISPTSDIIFALSGNNTNGFTLTGENGTLGVASLPTSSSNNKATSWTSTNNKWIIENSSYNNLENIFVIRNASGTNVALDYYNNGWQSYYVVGYKTNQYTALKLYTPIENAYNSNPAGAIVDPVVAFEKGGTTLYLDGTTTYRNAAIVNEVNKTATYTSSDESVATVGADGTVTAMGIGTATITASVAQELGVNNAASATYEIVVKSTTTIAGIKNITDAAGEVNFTADLTDAVVTYVKDNHAYIQDATAAIYASCGSNLTAGQKINGAVSGSVKAAYKIDEITSINLNEATVTNDGVIPAAEVKTLAEIKGSDYDGKLVTVNAATVSNSMANTANSGASISDDNGTTSFNLYAPNTGITVNASEIGNFTGFVSIYNGTTYRLNLYEQSQIVLTQRAARDQELSFDKDEIVLDEETTDFDNFIGQDVKGAQGTVTYAISGDVIGTVDNDGIVVLNGTCGTATVTATATAITKEVDGIPTPYNEATESYTITVRPRYSVVFAVNGVEETLREASFGEGVTVPSPAQLGDYYFVGWSTAVVETTDEAPSMPAIGATVYPEDNNGKYYAVYATKEVTGTPGSYMLDVLNESELYNKALAYATEKNFTAADGSNWLIHAYSQVNSTYGLQINTGKGASIKVPTCPGYITTITVTCKSDAIKAVGFSSTANGSAIISASNGTSQTLDLSGRKLNNGYIIPVEGTAVITKIVLNYGAVESYAGYTTSIPTPSITLGGIAGATETDYKFATFSADQAVVFTDDVTVYAVSVDENNNLVKTELTKDDYFVVGANSDGIVSGGYYVPANTGVMLRSTGASSNYYFAATDESVKIPTNMMIAGTNTVPSETDYKYYKLTYEDASHQHIGFYWGAAEGAPFMTKKGKAYLRLPKSVPARGFSLFDDDNTTTGISSMHNSELIKHNEVYNLNGQRVDNLKKGGLYIVNGKKMVIK